MRILTSLLPAAFLVSIIATQSEAQPRRPAAQPPRRPAPAAARPSGPLAGMLAVGASLGVTSTRSQFLGNGLELAGSVERYLSPQLSVRGQVGAAWWDIAGLTYTGTLQPVFFLGNVVYNWGGGDWYPYVTAGAGMYRYGFTEAGVSGSKTKGGFDFGGGGEYLFARNATITGEVLFHRVGLVPTNRAALGFKGSFWSFSLGAKKYF